MVPARFLVPVGEGEESGLLVPEVKSVGLLKESNWELSALKSELLPKESVLSQKESEPLVLKSERH